MDEFLDKLQEDQRRMRKYLRAKGSRFRTMGECLAEAVAGGGRVFIAGEPPLDALTRVIGRDYLSHLPVVLIDDPEETAAELTEADVLLAFLHEGTHKRIRRLLERARARHAAVLVIGGLGARTSNTRRQAKVLITLPTRGIKTLVESSFICARILARISRVGVGEGRQAEVEEDATGVEEGSADEPATTESPRSETPPRSGRARPKSDSRPKGSSRVQASLPRSASRPKSESRAKSEPRAKSDPRAKSESPTKSEPRGKSEAPQSEATIAKRSKRKRKLKPSVLELPALSPGDLEGADSAPLSPASSPPTQSPAESRSPAGSRPRSLSGSEPPTSEPPPRRDEAPVGLVSHEDPLAGPTFGSDIMLGSDIGDIGGTDAELQAIPISLEDDFLSELEVSRPASTSASGGSASEDHQAHHRMVSARFSVQDCTIRWGRGGFPDDSSPAHALIDFDEVQALFILDHHDEAAATLQIEDELWVRIEVPAFLEPILARGHIHDLTGSAGNGGTTATLLFGEVEAATRRKLERAASARR